MDPSIKSSVNSDLNSQALIRGKGYYKNWRSIDGTCSMSWPIPNHLLTFWVMILDLHAVAIIHAGKFEEGSPFILLS